LAKYEASPSYVVRHITFDTFGVYETDIPEEITILDALAPKWLKRTDKSEESQVAPKPRKPSASTSAK
jgi:hypothetical protein